MPNLTVNCTLEEFIDAIDKDGFKQTTGSLFVINKGQFQACALGQGLLNVGVASEEEIKNLIAEYSIGPIAALPDNEEVGEQIYYNWLTEKFGDDFSSAVYQLNDSGVSGHGGLNCHDIAVILRKRFL